MAISFNKSFSVTSSGNLIKVDSKPTRSQAFTFAFTYVILAPLLPTIIAAKCGVLWPLSFSSLTSNAISSLISAAVFFPFSKIIKLVFI